MDDDINIRPFDYNDIGRVYDFKSPLVEGEYFALELTDTIPSGSIPVVDEDSGMCIGYLYGISGVYDVYDATGEYLGKYELPLVSPLIDPLDIILLGGWFVKNGAKLTTLLKGGGTSLVKAGTIKLTDHLISLLRGRLKIGLSPRTLKFTPKAASHMAEAERYVPITIIEKAIRYGQRGVDTKGRSALILKRYIIKIKKYRYSSKIKNLNGKNINEVKEYTLEVVVDEKTWTVTHFMYK
ncbi:hypothetical protein [Proteus mirabilis]|uniref:hypothetical protein n=1 Tax=Proteus mirabilis TaxID=584 RepID=UPI002575CE9E|nr:hypothetical protein [Proteus mirabilis]MDM3623238.1 hypothetical protein [Proteus mirabilis]